MHPLTLLLTHSYYIFPTNLRILSNSPITPPAANQLTNQSRYDVRSYAKSSSAFPPNHDRVERYLNSKAVRAALHASKCSIAFKECTDPPYNALKHQDGLGVTKEVAFLLDRKVKSQ